MMQKITFKDMIDTANAFADSGMRITKAGKAMHLSHSAVVHRLKLLHKETGLNPYNFYALREILERYGGIEYGRFE